MMCPVCGRFVCGHSEADKLMACGQLYSDVDAEQERRKEMRRIRNLLRALVVVLVVMWVTIVLTGCITLPIRHEWRCLGPVTNEVEVRVWPMP